MCQNINAYNSLTHNVSESEFLNYVNIDGWKSYSPALFDCACYLDRYPELKILYENNCVGAKNYYDTNGTGLNHNA